MPRPTKGPRLGGSPAHERLMLANLATALFEHGRITTTKTKAKRVQPLVEKLITKAKRGTNPDAALHARRQVLRTIRDKDIVYTLFEEIAPGFASRNGGYTRVLNLPPRSGDNAPMALIELVEAQAPAAAESAAATAKAEAKQDSMAALAGESREEENSPQAVESDDAEAQSAENGDAQESSARESKEKDSNE